MHGSIVTIPTPRLRVLPLPADRFILVLDRADALPAGWTEEFAATMIEWGNEVGAASTLVLPGPVELDPSALTVDAAILDIITKAAGR